MTSSGKGRRVLVADDEIMILDSYRRVLGALVENSPEQGSDFDALSAELFGDDSSTTTKQLKDVVCCTQGEEAVRAIEEARVLGKPFSIVFLDMRMPPGIDGLEAARRIRAIDSDVNIVIVTGYSDHKPAEITAAVGHPEKLFYLVKPFDAAELQQLATALTSRWCADLEMANELARRLKELEAANARLKLSEAQAHEEARLDSLTGLSNRLGLKERFDRKNDEAAPHQLAVLYLDLDRFKDVNDSLGHAMGDELIKEFARRVRHVTGEDGFAARLGGDEFAVITTNPACVSELAKRLLSICSAPYKLGDHEVFSSVSVGVAYGDGDSQSLVDTMRRADIALYAAKAAGRGVLCEFDPSMERDILGPQRLAADLARAIKSEELSLHYQPLVSAAGEPITSVEALLRWKHPTQGMIAPLSFIAVAEKSDLMRKLGDWVFRRAFTEARLWPDLITAINVSPVQLRSRDFADRLIALAAEMSIDPTKFELEITETALIEDVEAAAAKIQKLKNAGFRVALDDFGSGYAGFSYLFQISFDRLKIDRFFISNLKLHTGADGVIRSIIGIARSLGLAVTAEGVETDDQHQFLKAAGCSQMQGFLFYRPMSSGELLNLRDSVEDGALCAQAR